MPYFPFYTKGIIHSKTDKDAKLFLSEMLINAIADNTAISMPPDTRPIKVFEVDVAEKLHIGEQEGERLQWT